MISAMNLSESARVTTAKEAAFRINRPNSLPRTTRVFALDAPSWETLKNVSHLPWQQTRFLSARRFDSTPPAEGGNAQITEWLEDVTGKARGLIGEIEGADLVVLVATAGHDPQMASVIGDACRERHINCAGIVLCQESEPLDDMVAIAKMRPHVRMLVAAKDIDYLTQMLVSLRA